MLRIKYVNLVGEALTEPKEYEDNINDINDITDVIEHYLNETENSIDKRYIRLWNDPDGGNIIIADYGSASQYVFIETDEYHDISKLVTTTRKGDH